VTRKDSPNKNTKSGATYLRGINKGESLLKIQKILFSRGPGAVLSLARFFTNVDT